MAGPTGARPWVVYDADCGICTRSARFLEKRDRGRLRLVPGASPEAQEALAAVGLQGVEQETLVLLGGRRPRLRSAAVVGALRRLPRLWPLAAFLLWLVPRPLRDAGYRWVARNRHRFGSACSVGP